MPSPWEALAARASTSVSPAPSPLILASSRTSTPSIDEGDEPRFRTKDEEVDNGRFSIKYLNQQLAEEEMLQNELNTDTSFPKLAPEIEEVRSFIPLKCFPLADGIRSSTRAMSSINSSSYPRLLLDLPDLLPSSSTACLREVGKPCTKSASAILDNLLDCHGKTLNQAWIRSIAWLVNLELPSSYYERSNSPRASEGKSIRPRLP